MTEITPKPQYQCNFCWVIVDEPKVDIITHYDTIGDSECHFCNVCERVFHEWWMTNRKEPKPKLENPAH